MSTPNSSATRCSSGPRADDGGEAPADDREAADDASRAADDGEEAPDWLETRLDADAGAIAGKLDTDLANVFPDDHGTPASETAPALPAETWSTAPSRQPVSVRGLQSRGLRRRGEVARRPPHRPARPGASPTRRCA